MKKVEKDVASLKREREGKKENVEEILKKWEERMKRKEERWEIREKEKEERKERKTNIIIKGVELNTEREVLNFVKEKLGVKRKRIKEMWNFKTSKVIGGS